MRMEEAEQDAAETELQLQDVIPPEVIRRQVSCLAHTLQLKDVYKNKSYSGILTVYSKSCQEVVCFYGNVAR